MYFFKKRPPKPLLQRRWRWSWRSSFWLHSILVSTVLMECLLVVAVPMPAGPAAEQIVLVAAPLAEPQEPPPVEINAFTPNTQNWLAEEAVDTSQVEAAQGDPRWERLTEADLDQRSPQEKAAASDFLAARVMDSIAEAEKHSDEENLQRLKQLTRQLNDGSTAESIAQVTTQISKFLGTGPRASEPAKEPVAGDFEIDTAQLHDVRREMLSDGTFKYIAILIDAAGRTNETEMPAAEGESAYKTFELIKQNPLLERVYRGVVMSLLDKVLKPNP